MDYKVVADMIEDKVYWGKRVGHNTLLIPLTITECEQIIKLLNEKATECRILTAMYMTGEEIDEETDEETDEE